MSKTLFYSWQSDSDKSTNRNFIEAALKKAIQELNESINVEESSRPEDLVLDKDTTGVPGTPPIVDTIFKKISEALVFVPDLTFIAKAKHGRHISNPNVLIEYGWALCKLSHDRMVPIMNSAYGEPSETTLPFDMRHLRRPITYNLREGADEENRANAKKGLMAELKEAINLIVKSAPTKQAPEQKYEPVLTTTSPSTFLQPDDKFIREDRFQSHNEQLRLPSNQQLFLRLMPTKPPTPLTSALVARELTKSGKLMPMMEMMSGFSFGRNCYGAFVLSRSEKDSSKIDFLTQLFKSGEIWGIDCESIDKERLMAHSHNNFGHFQCNYVEGVFVNTLENYLAFAQNSLKLQLPLRFIAGATDVEGYRMGTEHGYEGNVVDKHIVFDKGIVNEYGVSAIKLLRPFFDYLWEACGLKRPDKESLR